MISVNGNRQYFVCAKCLQRVDSCCCEKNAIQENIINIQSTILTNTVKKLSSTLKVDVVKCDERKNSIRVTIHLSNPNATIPFDDLATLMNELTRLTESCFDIEFHPSYYQLSFLLYLKKNLNLSMLTSYNNPQEFFEN